MVQRENMKSEFWRVTAMITTKIMGKRIIICKEHSWRLHG